MSQSVSHECRGGSDPASYDLWEGGDPGGPSPASDAGIYQPDSTTASQVGLDLSQEPEPAVPVDPAVLEQVQTLCERLGLIADDQPQALLQRLVSWGHKVLDHQDHLQQQLDVLKHDMMSPPHRSNSGSSRPGSNTSRASSDQDATAAGPSRLAPGECDTGATSATPRSSKQPHRRFNSGIDAELQQWLQQLDEAWQLAEPRPVTSNPGSARGSGNGAHNPGRAPAAAAATPAELSLPLPPTAQAEQQPGVAEGDGAAAVSAAAAPAAPVPKILLPDSGSSTSTAPGTGHSSLSSRRGHKAADLVSPAATAGITAGMGGVGTPAAPHTPAPGYTTEQRSRSLPESAAGDDASDSVVKAPAAVEGSHHHRHGSSRADSQSSNSGSSSAGSSHADLSLISPVAELPAVCPARSLWPAAAASGAAATAAVALPGGVAMPAAAGPSLPATAPSKSAAATSSSSDSRTKKVAAEPVAAAAAGAKAAPAGPPPPAPSSVLPRPRSPAPRDAPGQEAATGSSSAPSRDGLGLLLQPWQPPEHQVAGGLPRPVFSANAGASWMPSDTAAAARTAALTAHLRRTSGGGPGDGGSSEGEGLQQGTTSATARAVAQGSTPATEVAKRAGIMGMSYIRTQGTASFYRSSLRTGSSPADAAAASTSGGHRAPKRASEASGSSSDSGSDGSAGEARSSGSDSSSRSQRRAHAAHAAAAVIGLASVPEQVRLMGPLARTTGVFKAVAAQLCRLLQQLQARVPSCHQLLQWLQQQLHAAARQARTQGIRGASIWLAIVGLLGCSMGMLVAAAMSASQVDPQRRQRRAVRQALLRQMRHQPSWMLPRWKLREPDLAVLDPRGTSSMQLALAPPGTALAGSMRPSEAAAVGSLAPLCSSNALQPLALLPGSTAVGGSGGWAGEVAGDAKQLLQPTLARLAAAHTAAADATAGSSGGHSNRTSRAPQELPGGHLHLRMSRKGSKEDAPAALAGAGVAAGSHRSNSSSSSKAITQPQKMFWFVSPVKQHHACRKGNSGRKRALQQQKVAEVAQVSADVQNRLQPALRRLAAARKASA